jgi:ABC-type cobalamin/Fe3+-siderophores transport system ATPase subunit
MDTGSAKVDALITLKNINLKVKKGEFVCVIGDVGSGKSSLLSAIIGDMLYLDTEFLNKYGERKLSDIAGVLKMEEKVKERAHKEIKPEKAPIKIDGELSYV